jgi:DNA repair protein RecN (Recombination protein N)
MQEARLLGKLAQQGGMLSEKRKSSAVTMGKGIETELGDLKMSSARFSVDFQTKPDVNGIPLQDGTLARADEIPSLIFDEIDQGIGGRVGMVVGQKLWNLSRSHQVFCVTHLPQLAAFGDEHYQVQKLIQGNRTLTRVERLDGDPRLARTLADARRSG